MVDSEENYKRVGGSTIGGKFNFKIDIKLIRKIKTYFLRWYFMGLIFLIIFKKY